MLNHSQFANFKEEMKHCQQHSHASLTSSRSELSFSAVYRPSLIIKP